MFTCHGHAFMVYGMRHGPLCGCCYDPWTATACFVRAWAGAGLLLVLWASPFGWGPGLPVCRADFCSRELRIVSRKSFHHDFLVCMSDRAFITPVWPLSAAGFHNTYLGGTRFGPGACLL